MEDALKRLDKLTLEEARMAAAENLRLTQILINGTLSPLATWGLRLNLNAHALVRRKGNKASGSAYGKQRSVYGKQRSAHDKRRSTFGQ